MIENPDEFGIQSRTYFYQPVNSRITRIVLRRYPE
jgi:hypothetical protein